jgi:hypothetical protein
VYHHFHAGCKHQEYSSMGDGCSLLRRKVSKLEFLFCVSVVYLTVLPVARSVVTVEF